MRSFILSLTLLIFLSQFPHHECFDKESSVFGAVLSNPLESHANSKGISLADYLEPESSLSIPATSNEARSRRKRYLAFPEGASFSVKSTQLVLCLL